MIYTRKSKAGIKMEDNYIQRLIDKPMSQKGLVNAVGTHQTSANLTINVNIYIDNKRITKESSTAVLAELLKILTDTATKE
jgi:hypothetical protein